MRRRALLPLLVLLLPLHAAAQSRADALAAMERAASRFDEQLSVSGAYVWRYAPDGQARWGEGRVERDTGWVEPPGTPAVGAAFLRLYETSGDPRWLEAAGRSADALVRTQLRSGGWFYLMETDPEKRRDWCYSVDDVTADECEARRERNPNADRTVLDDDNTSAVLNFLMWYEATDPEPEPGVTKAIDRGLAALLRFQHRNGGWDALPETQPPEALVAPAWRASIPPSWPRTWVKPAGGPYFVLNDNLARDLLRMFLLAETRRQDPRLLAAAIRTGEFLLAAQLPPPQRGWAQTYDSEMQPVWGRRFEPPALATHETAGAIQALLELHARTGQPRYLDAAAEAAEWLRGVRLPDGRWPRFIELGSNRPLYVDSGFHLVSEPDDLLEGYTFRGVFEIPQTLAAVDARLAGRPFPAEPPWRSPADTLTPEETATQAKALIATQDPGGGWTGDGLVDSQKFVDGVFILARFAQEH